MLLGIEHRTIGPHPGIEQSGTFQSRLEAGPVDHAPAEPGDGRARWDFGDREDPHPFRAGRAASGERAEPGLTHGQPPCERAEPAGPEAGSDWAEYRGEQT